MKKVKLYEFDPCVYPLRLWVCKVDDASWVNNCFIKPTGEPLNMVQHIAGAVFTTKVCEHKKTAKYGVVVGIVRTDIEIGEIAHEAAHVAQMIWDWLGEKEIGIEADAFLVGWAADCIYKAYVKETSSDKTIEDGQTNNTSN